MPKTKKMLDRSLTTSSSAPLGGSLSLVKREEAESVVAEAWSNPMDFRTDQELSLETGLTLKDLRKLKTQPQFIRPVEEAFFRALPQLRMDVIRNLVRQSGGKSMQGTRLLGEALGVLPSKGSTTFILPGHVGGDVPTDDFSKMSDMELESTIARLLHDTNPGDVAYLEGRVLTQTDYEVIGAQEPSDDGREIPDVT
jgi:hypothetical protein